MKKPDTAATTPLVSIIVPAYNAEDFIGECLASITNQTYENLEIIVVDDGSTDSTPNIIRDFCALDSRVSLIQQQNQYAGVARNTGMDFAKGDYLLFLDADDFFDSTMVEKMIDRAQETSSDVIICKSNFYDNITKEYSPIDFSLCDVNVSQTYSGCELSDRIFQFCVGWPWDKLFNSSFIKRNKLKFQDLRTSNDARFVFLALCLATRISFVDEILVQHRTNNEKSLERTRSESCESAIYAADSIREYLIASDLYSQYEDSFINWYLNFIMWNLSSLDNKSRIKIIALLENPDHLFLQYPVHYNTEEASCIISILKQETREELLSTALMLAHEKAELKADVNWLREKALELEKDKQLLSSQYTSQISQLNNTLESIYSSKSWKLVQAIRSMLGRK